MEGLMVFRDVLLNVNEFSWRDTLFLPKDDIWSLSSMCAVLYTDDLEDSEEVPQFALDNNLVWALNIQDVQNIFENAKQQRFLCSDTDLLEAFLYYFDNDAFITFDAS